MNVLTKGYSHGTHRLVSPEVTLARITPHLGSFGITRCADVTGLDSIGISTFCIVRPASETVQTTNGKGLRRVDAMVSGLMEAIEVHHAQNPSVPFRRESIEGFARAGERWVDPATLPGFDHEIHFDEECRVDWTEGEDLFTGEQLWLPASAVYSSPKRSLFLWNSNGLASGNHPTEATLHALYEVLERHAMSSLVDGKDLRFDKVDVFDLDTITDPAVASLVSQIRDAGIELVFLRPRTGSTVHTFMAVLCDPRPFGLTRRIDPGYGAHLDPAVAAIRAITEAAQTRLTMIHGSREEIKPGTYDDARQRRLYDFFSRLRANTSWDALARHAHSDFEEDYRTVLEAARAAGVPAVYRAIMGSPTRQTPEISVVKVLVPGALHRFPI